MCYEHLKCNKQFKVIKSLLAISSSTFTTILTIYIPSTMDSGATTLSITTFSIVTLSVKGMSLTLDINVTQHYNALPLCSVYLCLVSHFVYWYAECHFAECCGAPFTNQNIVFRI